MVTLFPSLYYILVYDFEVYLFLFKIFNNLPYLIIVIYLYYLFEKMIILFSRHQTIYQEIPNLLNYSVISIFFKIYSDCTLSP